MCDICEREIDNVGQLAGANINGRMEPLPKGWTAQQAGVYLASRSINYAAFLLRQEQDGLDAEHHRASRRQRIIKWFRR